VNSSPQSDESQASHFSHSFFVLNLAVCCYAGALGGSKGQTRVLKTGTRRAVTYKSRNNSDFFPPFPLSSFLPVIVNSRILFYNRMLHIYAFTQRSRISTHLSQRFPPLSVSAIYLPSPLLVSLYILLLLLVPPPSLSRVDALFVNVAALDGSTIDSWPATAR
jgi:hypothetical protein